MNLRQIFLNNIAQTSNAPLALEFPYAEGSFLYDKDGKKYLDLISGISVSNVGHRHPRVVEAIKSQADKYLHQLVYGEFVQSPQVLLAQKLVSTMAESPTHRGDIIDNVYFTNSGTEAVEGAMKLAKRFTGRPGLVACNRAYHGSTQGPLSFGEEDYIRNYRPLLPSISKIGRNQYEDLSVINHHTAAVIIEPIGAESGIHPTEVKFMKQLSERCKAVGALLIFDEVQTGLGRTGYTWALEKFGFAPDIVITAKALGGGLPLGAFMASKRIMSVLMSNPVLGHITTFGGNPMSTAAGLAALEVLLDEIDLSEIVRKGKRIKEIFENHPKVTEVRGEGLMIGADFGNFRTLKRHIDSYIKKGLITDWFLYSDNTMRISPPLNISDEEIDLLKEIILE